MKTKPTTNYAEGMGSLVGPPKPLPPGAGPYADPYNESKMGFLMVGPRIGRLRIACSISERHRRSAQVIEHPIEAGSNVADHRNIGPPEFDIDGLISNLSVGPSDDPELVPPKDGFIDLRLLFTRAEPFRIVTGLTIYDNMVFTDLQIQRDKTTGSSIKFTASARQIIFAVGQTVDVLATFAGLENLGPKKDVGPKDKKETTNTKTKETLRSGLHKVKHSQKLKQINEAIRQRTTDILKGVGF